jgi:hypothetical protein
MATDLTSITGIVIPASWDTSGTITGTAIVTFDEDHVAVADTGFGRDLVFHLRETVTVFGQIRVQGLSKTIHVHKISFTGAEEVPGQSVIDRSISGC